MKVNVKYKHVFFFLSKLMMDFIREPAYCPEWFHLAAAFHGFSCSCGGRLAPDVCWWHVVVTKLDSETSLTRGMKVEDFSFYLPRKKG